MPIFADQRACWQPYAAPAPALPIRTLRPSVPRACAPLPDERLSSQLTLALSPTSAGTTALPEPTTTGRSRRPRRLTPRLTAVRPQDLAGLDLARTGDPVTVSGQLRTGRFRRYLVIFGNTVAPCATADRPQPPRHPGRAPHHPALLGPDLRLPGQVTP